MTEDAVQGSYRTEAHAESELIGGLEPDQVVGSATRPFSRMHIGRAGACGLWALRILVLLVSAMVVYTFVASLRVAG